MTAFCTPLQNSPIGAFWVITRPYHWPPGKNKKKAQATWTSGVSQAENHTKCNDICLIDFQLLMPMLNQGPAPEQCPHYTGVWKLAHTSNKCIWATTIIHYHLPMEVLHIFPRPPRPTNIPSLSTPKTQSHSLKFFEFIGSLGGLLPCRKNRTTQVKECNNQPSLPP